uniref:FAD dependent oxidoreductase domain-containing protein n=2 Tax=Schizophyllum commune (strain H4-8 / FGSC 9210) TaxID=578458 RepID=D8Q542_SCHCM
MENTWVSGGKNHKTFVAPAGASAITCRRDLWRDDYAEMDGLTKMVRVTKMDAVTKEISKPRHSQLSSDTPLLHLSFDRDPLIAPSDHAAHVLVIGGGIIGLSTAWTLLDSGYKVTVLAEEYATLDGSKPRLTSQIAGALWEYPPAVCGHTSDVTSLEISKRWAMVSYHVYKHMAADLVLATKYSVKMRETVFFFDKHVRDDAEQLRKMREIERSGVAGFRHDTKVIHQLGLDEKKWLDAYEILSPLIDTDKALVNIQKLVVAKGATLVTGKVEKDLLEVEQELRSKYDAQVIVNATGLGAWTLANDKNVYPLRGAVLRIPNDGQKFEKIKKALVVSAVDVPSDKNPSKFIFIVPRNDGILYVGGFSEPNKTDFIPEDDPNVLMMARDAEDFYTELDTERRDSAFPLAQGFRPARKGDVRVERELRTPAGSTDKNWRPIVHSYGHAGAGWSLAFGSALEVKALVEDVLEGLPAHSMKEAAPSVVSHAQAATTPAQAASACLRLSSPSSWSSIYLDDTSQISDIQRLIHRVTAALTCARNAHTTVNKPSSELLQPIFAFVQPSYEDCASVAFLQIS